MIKRRRWVPLFGLPVLETHLYSINTMNWQSFWDHQSKQTDPLLQVGRKGGYVNNQEVFLETYAAYVAEQIGLTPDDVLLDVCCGNGLLTSYLAKHCKAVLGVDFSDKLIAQAKRNHESQLVTFVCADALVLGELKIKHPAVNLPFTKSTLCFSFQYFETVSLGKQVVEGIFNQGPSVLFLGDVPDRDRFFYYYKSWRDLARLVKHMLQQRNDMGKFWSLEELTFIAKSLGKQGKKVTQPDSFPYAHYRMDFLISNS